MSLSPLIVWTVTMIGAAFLMKLFSREWQRINADLERARAVRVSASDRAAMPTLRRDPVTGEYRPFR